MRKLEKEEKEQMLLRKPNSVMQPFISGKLSTSSDSIMSKIPSEESSISIAVNCKLNYVG